MRPQTEQPNDDWTRGPAGWAPILLLTLLTTIGALGAVTTPRINTGAHFGAHPGANPGTGPIAEARINVNTATNARLQLLPRIGPRLAQRIIEDRNSNGPFVDAQDIQRVKGIGPKTASRLAAVADFSVPSPD